MIGKLKGIVDEIYTDSVIIDVAGVGYVVYASSKTLQELGQGDAVSVIIETVVKEDAITLYGFIKAEEKQLFKTLLTVQGVGAKMALAILSTFSPNELRNAIASGDKKMLTRANGVGAKIAVRIITELENKIDTGGISISTDATDDTAHAVSALLNLGFARSQVYSVINDAKKDGFSKMEDLIREGLKKLS